jgi:hypothetical protein
MERLRIKERGGRYGLVSWEEKGSMSDSINMFARTKYFKT